MSDERRRARERAAAQGDPEAVAAAGRALCRTDGCDARARIARDEGGSPWLRVEVGPGLVHAFPLTIEDTAAEWAVTLNCDPAFRARGFVAAPARSALAVHGVRCPRCGDLAAPVDVDGVASRGAQRIDTTIRARGTYPTGRIDPATLELAAMVDPPAALGALGIAPRRVMVTEPGQPERRCARDHRCQPDGGEGEGMCLDADGYPDDDL